MAAASSSSAPSSSTALLRHPLSYPSRRPPADDLESSWILEFVLRQPIPDSLANEVFLSLPFSSPELHPHLRKTLLLRRLSSDLRRRSISERTLDSLELIEELDRLLGTGPSNRMKAAYCAASVECTTSAYRRGAADFKDAVKRIWMSRISNLMQSEAAAGLVSEPLVQWLKRMCLSLSSCDGNQELLENDVEGAMSLVKDYVDGAMKEMEPSFLEIAASEFVENRTALDAGANKAGKGITMANGHCGKLDEKDKEFEEYGIGEKAGESAGVSTLGMDEDEVQVRSGGLADSSWKELDDYRAREESAGLDDTLMKLDKDGRFAMGSSQVLLEGEVEDNRRIENVSGHDKTDQIERLSHRFDPDEVSRVKEALKKSCFDLNMVVEDPLPEAQAAAAAVLASMSHDHAFLSENAKQSSAGNAVLPVPASGDSRGGTLEDARFKVNGESSDFKLLEGNHVGKDCSAGPSKSLNIVSCGTIFERNPTAHTCEWSDLDSFENSPVPSGNLQSPNPMKRRICLPRLDKEKFVRRRAVRRWTPQEEDKLREAVAKYGKGNWKLILNSYSKIFEERTEVDLKDKWRNLTRG